MSQFINILAIYQFEILQFAGGLSRSITTLLSLSMYIGVENICGHSLPPDELSSRLTKLIPPIRQLELRLEEITP